MLMNGPPLHTPPSSSSSSSFSTPANIVLSISESRRRKERSVIGRLAKEKSEEEFYSARLLQESADGAVCLALFRRRRPWPTKMAFSSHCISMWKKKEDNEKKRRKTKKNNKRDWGVVVEFSLLHHVLPKVHL